MRWETGERVRLRPCRQEKQTHTQNASLFLLGQFLEPSIEGAP